MASGDGTREGVDHFREYPLCEALLKRRSRRFSRGMTIRGGALEYDSDAEPYPLTEEEEAVLAFAACGFTGPALGDWEYMEETMGNSFASFTGRTVSSPDAVHTVSVFVINDDGAWLARRPQDLSSEDRAAVAGLARDGEFVEAWRRMRVQVADERVAPPSELPQNIPPNQWSMHAEGTTYFLPVYEQTQLMLNVLLGGLAEDFGMFFVDDRRMFQPAGVGEHAESKGGHLHDDPEEGLTIPISMFERTAGEMCSVEQGMVMQNLGLACQAMGLAGFPHNCQFDPAAWFEALDFRMQEMRSSDYMSVPWPVSWMMRLTGADEPIRYPVGLERDGEVLLKAYTPPYYDSMEDAIRSLVEEKFGEGGVYDGRPEGYEGREPNTGWKHPREVAEQVSGVSERALQAAIDHCEYIWENHGRFPVNFAPFHTFVGFQVGHADEGFYERYYRHGTLDETHRNHMERWHAE